MNKRITVLMGLSLMLAAAVVFAQMPTLKAPIDFPFTVNSKVLPGGEYSFTRTTDGKAFRVQGEGKEGTLAIIVTRLGGEMHQNMPESYVVFDKIGEIYVLSEIWIPGEDGFLLSTTKAKHTHMTVHMK